MFSISLSLLKQDIIKKRQVNKININELFKLGHELDIRDDKKY